MNGYSTWNAWNVSLWLHNDEHLYKDMMYAIRRSTFVQTSAACLLEVLDTHTPDGAEYNVDDLIEAIADEHSEYWGDC